MSENSLNPNYYTNLIIFVSRSCIDFLENRLGAPRRNDWSRPQVADTGAQYRGLLLNTDTKLDKQTRIMF